MARRSGGCPMRVTYKLVTMLLLLCATVFSLWAQERRTPITKEQMTYLITRSSLTEERLVQLIEKYGIGFAVTPGVLEELQQAGAGPQTLEAITRQGPSAVVEENSPRPRREETLRKRVVEPD